MSFMKRILGEDASHKTRGLAKGDYLDLGEFAASNADTPASSYIHVAEIHKVEDLKEFTTLVFEGHVLLVDIRPIMGDEITLRRVTNELRRVATDIGGDLAGVAEHILALTPAGMRVDRRKLRATPP